MPQLHLQSFETLKDANGRLMNALTTSNNTSPAVNSSPSAFFHDAIPPSVIVGDMAGIRIAVVAYRTLFKSA